MEKLLIRTISNIGLGINAMITSPTTFLFRLQSFYLPTEIKLINFNEEANIITYQISNEYLIKYYLKAFRVINVEITKI